jgi:hypothetical protein
MFSLVKSPKKKKAEETCNNEIIMDVLPPINPETQRRLQELIAPIPLLLLETQT